MPIQAKIVIFTSPSCSWCTRAKQFFKQKRLRFKEIDVTKNASGAKDILHRTGQSGVPVILINNRIIIGFDVAKINRLLKS